MNKKSLVLLALGESEADVTEKNSVRIYEELKHLAAKQLYVCILVNYQDMRHAKYLFNCSALAQISES